LFNSISLPFDHGGSDLLRVIQDLGIIGTIIFFVIIKKYFMINELKFICLMPFVILLAIKGIGIYSISALLPFIFTIFLLTFFSNKN
jgi:hypothetical protein